MFLKSVTNNAPQILSDAITASSYSLVFLGIEGCLGTVVSNKFIRSLLPEPAMKVFPYVGIFISLIFLSLINLHTYCFIIIGMKCNLAIKRIIKKTT